MKKISVIILLVFALISLQTKAQFGGSKVILKSGSLKSIVAEKTLNVKYDYSNIKVGAFNSESEYVNKKVEEYNKKKAGDGERWKKGWEGSRTDRYQPKFEELINKNLSKLGIKVSENANDAKYTLIVKTTFIEPGFNVGVAKKPAFCNYEFVIVETANESTVVAELYLNNVIGSQAMGFDFDNGSRIAESYAKAGKMLGAFMVKNKDK